MRILITGSNGFLGYRLSRKLDEKYEVYAMNHHELDVTNLDSVHKAFQTIKPEIVIHCAAISDRRLCEKEIERAYQTNVIGTINMAEICHELQARIAQYKYT